MSQKTEESKSKKNNILNNIVNIINKEDVKVKKTTAKKTDKSDVPSSKSKSTKKTNTSSSKKDKVLKDKTSKTTNAKKTAKKSSTPKAKTPAKKASKVLKKSTSVKTNKSVKSSPVVEYYDLPYRYNETIVKILYQTPNTLFVYWDISDEDRANYIKEYGENFFNITRPVLIIHNITMNYSFEVPINDFANSWYLHVNDSKCDYKVELGRRPNYYNEEATKQIQENIHTDYIYVSTSNEIESPNDHVLFTTNANNEVKIRNIKNQEEKSVSIFDIIKKLPATKNKENIPYISKEILKDMYSSIYQNEDITFFDKISNPSSGNPTSGNIHSRI